MSYIIIIIIIIKYAVSLSTSFRTLQVAQSSQPFSVFINIHHNYTYVLILIPFILDIIHPIHNFVILKITNNPQKLSQSPNQSCHNHVWLHPHNIFLILALIPYTIDIIFPFSDEIVFSEFHCCFVPNPQSVYHKHVWYSTHFHFCVRIQSPTYLHDDLLLVQPTTFFYMLLFVCFAESCCGVISF